MPAATSADVPRRTFFIPLLPSSRCFSGHATTSLTVFVGRRLVAASPTLLCRRAGTVNKAPAPAGAKLSHCDENATSLQGSAACRRLHGATAEANKRSEEHTSELPSLMRLSSAV